MHVSVILPNPSAMPGSISIAFRVSHLPQRSRTLLDPFSSSIHPFFAVFHNPSAYFSLEPWMLFCIRKGDPFKRYLLLCLNNLCNSLTERYSMCGGISVFLCWADPYRSKPHVFPILSPGFAKHTIPCADRFRHEHIKSDAVIPMGNHSPFRTILCVSSP